MLFPCVFIVYLFFLLCSQNLPPSMIQIQTLPQSHLNYSTAPHTWRLKRYFLLYHEDVLWPIDLKCADKRVFESLINYASKGLLSYEMYYVK